MSLLQRAILVQKDLHQSHLTTPILGIDNETKDAFLGPSVNDVEIDGLDLETAAERLGIGTDDLWRRIRNGQLMARSLRGKVYVYSSLSHADEPAAAIRDVRGATALPPISMTMTTEQNPAQVVLTRLQEGLPESSLNNSIAVVNHDISVLVDHLNLAKEENREIIRLTQDSMSRLTEMTDAMIQMKDEVITAREQQVDMLNERLRSQSDQLRAALKEKENLETLARALMVPQE